LIFSIYAVNCLERVVYELSHSSIVHIAAADSLAVFNLQLILMAYLLYGVNVHCGETVVCQVPAGSNKETDGCRQTSCSMSAATV